MRTVLIVGVTAVWLVVAGCSRPVPDPMQLNGGILTVDNRTEHPWQGVEIWLNRVYRVTAPSIAAGSRFTVSLSTFVAGFGQRFPYGRQQITDLRLSATQPDGTPVELVFPFRKSPFEEVFGGK